MADSRKILRVFLASPGDLQEERRAAKSVVEKFNESWADHLSYHVELVGWEDTVTIYGRPQATINRDLERCELFIGMMWKRWGTPPDVIGPYTSGFEEEFRTAEANRKSKGSPEIGLYFKNIDAEFMHDPGVGLKKVLAFKDQIISEKTILFEQFNSAEEFQEKFERCIVRYVQRRLSEDIREQAEAKQAESSESRVSQSQSETSSISETPLSPEGVKFLGDFIARVESDTEEEAISNIDVARFRLLGYIVGEQGNDERPIGAHDANILFAKRSKLELSYRERVGLVKTGLFHYSSENTPLWCWLSTINAFKRNSLPIFTMFGEKEQRVSALSAMQLVSEPLPPDGHIDKAKAFKSWFAESSPTAVKTAALKYLADYGSAPDLPVIKAEADREDYKTVNVAVDAILRIKLKDSRQKAILALFELQPQSIDSNLLAALFEKGAQIDTTVLSQGVGHRCSEVRRIVVKILREQGALDVDTADQLTSDSDAGVRFEALQCLVSAGRQFSDNEAKKILVKPKAAQGLGLFRPVGASDSDGEVFWKEFREMRLASMTDHDLEKAAGESLIFDRTAQFLLYERRFSKFGNELRGAVDDRFRAAIAEELDKMALKFGSESKTIEQIRTLEEYLRKKLTRNGLDIICRKGDPQDLGRVRSILKTGFVDYSDSDIEYLRKLGEWEDIPLIISTLDLPDGMQNSLLAFTTKNAKYRAVARSLYSLGRARLEELLSIQMPDRLLLYLIVDSSDEAFSTLSNISIIRLFRLENDDIRKAAALKCIRALTKSRLTKLLNEYVSDEVFQYYSVIHWLDFGVSVPRERARPAVKIVIAREWGT